MLFTIIVRRNFAQAEGKCSNVNCNHINTNQFNNYRDRKRISKLTYDVIVAYV